MAKCDHLTSLPFKGLKDLNSLSCHIFSTLNTSTASFHCQLSTTTSLQLLLLLVLLSDDHHNVKRITFSQSSDLTPSIVTVSSRALSINLCKAASGDEAVDTVTGTSHCVLLPASIHTIQVITCIDNTAHLSDSVSHCINLPHLLCIS